MVQRVRQPVFQKLESFAQTSLIKEHRGKIDDRVRIARRVNQPGADVLKIRAEILVDLKILLRVADDFVADVPAHFRARFRAERVDEHRGVTRLLPFVLVAEPAEKQKCQREIPRDAERDQHEKNAPPVEMQAPLPVVPAGVRREP